MALFDLDGTLLRGESFSRFLRMLVLGSPWRTLLAALGTPLALPLMVSVRTRHLGASVYLLAGTVGLSQRQMDEAVDSFATTHADRRAGHHIDAVLGALRDHVAAGDRVVIVTACGAPLASRLRELLGLPIDVEILATPIRRWFAGWVVSAWVSGPVKLRAIEAAGLGTRFSYAYGDGPSDLALMRRADHPVLVEPTWWKRVRMSRRLPAMTVIGR